MSKFVDEIVKDMRENPAAWVISSYRMRLERDGVAVYDYGNGSKWHLMWLSSIVEVSVKEKTIPLSWSDKYKLEEACKHWLKNATLEMIAR
jgi:hypothetical protein